jgi:hypothetical protein
MADPKPWLVILALQSQLQGITRANGYLTDAGTAVWTEPKQRAQTDALGISIITQHIDRWQGERPNKRGRALALTVEAAIPTDLDTAHQYAHQLIEDIEVCLAKNIAINLLPDVSGVTSFELESAEMADRPEGLPIIAVVLTISAGYLR